MLLAGSEASGASTSGGETTLKLWTHNGGNAAEFALDKKIVADFNASQSMYKVAVQVPYASRALRHPARRHVRTAVGHAGTG